MKRLIVCCDGTWNNPEQEDNGIPCPTNVVKIRNAIAKEDADGNSQLVYYHPGVGGEDKGVVSAALGGAIGMGISRHICSAYHWLATRYEEGDEIYLFGFSRGAFTARSLGGMLGRGLLDLRNVKPKESWERVHTAYDKGYRIKDAKRKSWAKTDWTFFHGPKPTPVHFIGVWDTVGALGIPDDLELLNLFDKPQNWAFHDASLGDHIRHARHAMAIDEVRSSFSITRWDNIAKRNNDDEKSAEELWFPGVHSDVGGGYAHCDLSDGALKWMMDESEAKGLAFRNGVQNQLNPNPLGLMHKSFKGAFAALRSRPRNIPAMVSRNQKQFHESALTRQEASPIEYDPYHPTQLLEPGQSTTVDVYADTRWNETGVYLRKGKYIFKAHGEWQDSKDTCDWRGTEDGKLTFGDVMRSGGSFIGVFENFFGKITDNKSTDFLMTKRVEHLPWFVMVGAITNDAGPKPKAPKDDDTNPVSHDGSPTPHQYVALPEHTKAPLNVTKPGYLYCFPNDVWSLYDNNRGSIQLTITRVS